MVPIMELWIAVKHCSQTEECVLGISPSHRCYGHFVYLQFNFRRTYIYVEQQ